MRSCGIDKQIKRVVVDMKEGKAAMTYSEQQEFEFLKKFIDEIACLQDDFLKLIQTYHPVEITMKRGKMKWVLPTWVMLFQESLECMINYVTQYEVKVFKKFNNQFFCASRLKVVHNGNNNNNNNNDSGDSNSASSSASNDANNDV